jgi:hypothetical protein
MKANEPTMPGLLMSRIQKVSASLKALFLVAAVISALVSLSATIVMLESYSNEKLQDAVSLLFWAAVYWCAYRLFRACSGGHLFSLEVVRNLRRIGGLGILLGLEEGVTYFVEGIGDIPLWSDLIFLPCYAFSIVPGIAFLCIAWILDEGRKMQEERELTV